MGLRPKPRGGFAARILLGAPPADTHRDSAPDPRAHPAKLDLEKFGDEAARPNWRLDLIMTSLTFPRPPASLRPWMCGTMSEMPVYIKYFCQVTRIESCHQLIVEPWKILRR